MGVAKIRSQKWLEAMISNGDSMVQAGDSLAVANYLKWSRMSHPTFSHLTYEELFAIIEYLDEYKPKNRH